MVPYFLNPQLLDLLLSLIKSDQSQAVQRLAAKTLVIVGALDYNIQKKISPISFEKIQMLAQQDAVTDFDNMTIQRQNQQFKKALIESHGQVQIDPITGVVIDKNEIIKIENKDVVIQKSNGINYVLVVMTQIRELISQYNTEEIYLQAMISFRKSIQFIQNKPVSNEVNCIIEDILDYGINIVKRTKNVSFQGKLLQELTYTVSNLNPQIRSYLSPLFELVYQLWDIKQLTKLVFALLEELVLKFPGYDFVQQNGQIVQKLLQQYTIQNNTLSHQKQNIEQQTIIRSFNTLIVLLPSLKSQVQVLLPCLLKLAHNWRNNEELCFAALDCIGRICCTTSIMQMQSNLIQTLLKIMRETAEFIRPTMQQVYS